MLATLIKILPVLWPFFKEMVLGGKKEPGEADKPSRLKALFYIIVFLLAALGYGGYQALHLVQRLHDVESENAGLTEKIKGTVEFGADARLERDQLREDNRGYIARMRLLRESQLELTTKLAQSNADLVVSLSRNNELQSELKEAQTKLKEAEDAADSLSKFRTNPQTPRSLKQHNEAVDVLRQLREEANNGRYQ
jgi:chromosome segregation ATPase